MSGRLVLLCGSSFSGKSTLARALAEALPAVVVSLDAINDERGLHGGEGISIEEWAATMDIAHERVGAALRDSAAVVVDDTSSPRFLRDAVLRGHLDGFKAPDDDERAVRLSAEDVASPPAVHTVRHAVNSTLTCWPHRDRSRRHRLHDTASSDARSSSIRWELACQTPWSTGAKPSKCS